MLRKYDRSKVGVFPVWTGCAVIGPEEFAIVSHERLDNPVGQETPWLEFQSQATEANVHLAELDTTKMQSTTVKEADVVPKNTITSAHNDEGEGADGPSQRSNTSVIITPE